jgi:hypothetical protein
MCKALPMRWIHKPTRFVQWLERSRHVVWLRRACRWPRRIAELAFALDVLTEEVRHLMKPSLSKVALELKVRGVRLLNTVRFGSCIGFSAREVEVLVGCKMRALFNWGMWKNYRIRGEYRHSRRALALRVFLIFDFATPDLKIHVYQTAYGVIKQQSLGSKDT